MKKLLSLVICMFVCLSTWAFNWSTVDYAGDGAGGGTYTNKYKFYCETSTVKLVNIQKPDWATDAGLYVGFPAGISTCSLGDGNYDVQGAGILLHLSAFTKIETEFTVTDAQGTYTCYVYYADGTGDVTVGNEEITIPEVTAPTAAAPIPTKEATNVKAIYSDSYTVSPTWGYCEGWGQATSLTASAISGNNYLLYNSFNYLGWGCASSVDASDMEYLHLDVWAQKNGSVDVYPIYGGSGLTTDDSHFKTLSLVGQEWNTFDIPTSDFGSLDLSSIFQFKFANGVTCSTFAIDNVYFWKAPVVVDTEVPVINTVTAGTLKYNSCTLTVDATDNIGVTSYVVKNGDTEVATSTTNVIEVTGLEASTEYTLTVYAKDKAGNTSAGKNVTFTTSVKPTAYWASGSDATNGIDILYSIVYNADKTLTYHIEVATTKTGVTCQVNDGDWRTATLTNGAYEYTSETTYEEGAMVAGFFYFPYAGGAGRVDFNYTVGDLQEKPTISVSGVTLDKTAAELLPTETVQLTANVNPGTATNKNVTWSSSNAGVATVSDAGLVTAVAAGTANITVTTVDGSFTATCTVTVSSSLAATTFYGVGKDAGNDIQLAYTITRNSDRTLSYSVTAFQSHDGFVLQVNDGAWNTATVEEGTYKYTSTTTYEDGKTLNGFFYMPYAGGAGRVDFTYVVGSENEEYTREINSGNFGTLCLNKAENTSNYIGATVYSIAGRRGTAEAPTSIVLKEETGTLEAGKPYIFCATADKLVAVLSGDAVAAPVTENTNGLYGSFVAMDVEEGMYLVSGTQIVKCGTGCDIAANRAYINMTEVPEYSDTTPAKGIIELGFEGDDTTAISDLTPALSQGEGAMYNLAGQRVNANAKGIVIVNGKKFINK